MTRQEEFKEPFTEVPNVKEPGIFDLILVGIPSSLILSVNNKGGGGLFNGWNLLCLTKAVFQTFLKHKIGSVNSHLKLE